MTEKNFRNKISFVTFLCAVIVIIAHSNTITDIQGNIPVSNFIINVVADSLFHNVVAVFIFVSGVLFYRNFSEDQMKRKLKSRTKSVLMPYIVWNLLYTLVAFFFFYVLKISGSLGETWGVNGDPLMDFLEGVFYFGHNKPFWSMFTLIVLCLINPLMYYFIKNKYVGFVFLLVCFIVYHYYPAMPLIPYVALRYVFIYFLGGYLSLHFKDILEREFSNKERLAGLVLYIVNLVAYYLNVKCHVGGLIAVIQYFDVPLYTLSFFVFVKWFDNKDYPGYLKNTFFMYGSHIFVLALVKKIFVTVLGKSDLALTAAYILTIVSTAVITAFLAEVTKKIMPKVYSVLSGGR